MNLHVWINAIAVLILAVSIAIIGSTSSALAAPSSYQRTCENISIEGNVLSAICKKKNGSPNRTSITLKGIENINGTLKVLNLTKRLTLTSLAKIFLLMEIYFQANVKRWIETGHQPR